ncbi:MAG: hypothetical protein MK207_01570 [Saprospiraceae bacterium]|nr:hypothetical protein [Saprospiraceae bacterium]
METQKWKKTNAKISLKEKRTTGLIKLKYFFSLMYTVEKIRNLNSEEKERNKSHKKMLKSLENIFPILDEIKPIITLSGENSNSENENQKVIYNDLIVKDVEVSKEIFNKYYKAKTIPLQYDSSNPKRIKFI